MGLFTDIHLNVSSKISSEFQHICDFTFDFIRDITNAICRNSMKTDFVYNYRQTAFKWFDSNYTLPSRMHYEISHWSWVVVTFAAKIAKWKIFSCLHLNDFDCKWIFTDGRFDNCQCNSWMHMISKCVICWSFYIGKLEFKINTNWFLCMQLFLFPFRWNVWVFICSYFNQCKCGAFQIKIKAIQFP